MKIPPANQPRTPSKVRSGQISGAAPAEIRTILVPLDFDARSRQLLLHASSVARQIGARLLLLHVCPPVFHAPAHLTALEFEKWQTVLIHNAEAKLRKITTEFPGELPISQAEVLVTRGFLEEQIRAVAKQAKADLILVSTHGYLGIKHFFLGSKTEHLVRRSPCPVLVIPQGLPLGREA